MKNNFSVRCGFLITTTEKGEVTKKETCHELDMFVEMAEKYINLDKEEWEELFRTKHVTSINVLGNEIYFEQMVEVECGQCGGVTTFTTLELDHCEQEWDDESLRYCGCSYCQRDYLEEDEEE